jgi:hypothetical protein
MSVRLLLFSLTCLALGLCVLAGESPMEKAVAKSAQEVRPEVNPALPDTAHDAVMRDPATRQRYLAAMQRFYEYRANGYAYRSRVFEWQLLSSRLIFIIVLVLVSAGIYFAAVQFHVAMMTARRNLTLAADAPPAANPLDTKLELSATGVVVNSSVLGVIILGLSLAFFYLYLVYVYPIQNVF